MTGNAFHELRDVKIFPSVGMKKLPPVHLKTNFGQEPFVFDIDGMVKVCNSQFATFREQQANPPTSKRDLISKLRLMLHL